MKIDFYLSEMSVSDRHGGGITAQKILGEDLAAIDRFIHPLRFARDLPPIASLQNRSEFFLNFFEQDLPRRTIGSRLSRWCFETRAVQAAHVRYVAHRLDRAFTSGRTLKALVCPQGLLAVPILEALKRLRPVHYVTWVMDDHAVRFTGGAWQYPPWFRPQFQHHLQEASDVLVISPALGDFYRKEFGVESRVLVGPADEADEPVWHSPSANGISRVGYFGSIGAWQLDALARFAAALPAGKAVLHIYSNLEVAPPELRLPTVEFKGSLPKEKVVATMREYDAVLLPISFLESQRHLSEFNIATKMSECLASGTVTIAYGPAYAAMTRILAPTGAACVLFGESPAEVGDALARLRDAGQRRLLLEKARQFVRKELSSRVMRERWEAARNKLTASTA